MSQPHSMPATKLQVWIQAGQALAPGAAPPQLAAERPLREALQKGRAEADGQARSLLSGWMQLLPAALAERLPALVEVLPPPTAMAVRRRADRPEE